MVTADPAANIDAAIHVAHAFTVHGEEPEYDFFTVVDDLHEEGSGQGAADHLNESELVCGLFYGYVVVDRNTLLGNVDGDAALAGEIVRRLVRVIATVSPGARRGPTAPYGYASWMLAEAGDEQPRSLAEAFRTPAAPTREDAHAKLNAHLANVDRAYGSGNRRMALHIDGAETTGAGAATTLDELAAFAAAAIAGASR